MELVPISFNGVGRTLEGPIQGIVDARHFHRQIPSANVGVEGAPKAAEIAIVPGHLADQQPAGDGRATVRQGQPAEPEWHMEGPPKALEETVNQWNKYILRFALDS